MGKIKYPEFPVLIVDDEAEVIQGCELILRTHGISNIVTCQDSRKVMPLLAEQEVQAILLDLVMPYLSGEELLHDIKQLYPHIPIIVITGIDKVDTAINCMKAGAFDYMVKPVEELRLISSIRHAVNRIEERNEYQAFKQLVLNDDLNSPEGFSQIITRNKKMRAIFQYVEAIAGTRQPVLITGDSGVGKGLIAESIHTISQRSGSFSRINIAGLDDTLFSDSLFGHLRGAFTGAAEIRQGLIEQAASGTLFLDEIGDLNPASQIKLLRLIEDSEYFKVGSDHLKKTDARFITATNKNIHLLQKEGTFRTDLYFRLQFHHIHIPSLRERFDDLPLLLDHFLREASQSLGKKTPTPPKELLSLLASYHFPGNIRELRAMIFEAVINHKSKILSMKCFENHISKHRSQNEIIENEDPKSTLYAFTDELPTLKFARKQLIKEALERHNGNITMAARVLGISQPGLSNLLKREDPLKG